MTKKQILKKTKKSLLILITVLLMLGVMFTILTLPFLNKIYPNIYVAGSYVGDKQKEDAIKMLTDSYKIPSKIVLDINGIKSEILTSEIVNDVDYSSSIDRAYNITNSGNLIYDTYKKIDLIFKPINLSPVININEDKLLETLLIASSKSGQKAVNPSVSKISGVIVVNKGKNGIEIDVQKARLDIGDALANKRDDEIKVELNEIKTELNDTESQNYKNAAEKLLDKHLDLKLDDLNIVLDDNILISILGPYGYLDEKLNSEILKIAKQLNRNPQDSVFVINNGVVQEFAPSKDGIVVNEKLLSEKIKDSANNMMSTDTQSTQIDIPVVKTSPKIKNEDVNNLGIKTLLGKGFSNFKGSIPNRIHNVNLAQSKFKGILVPPNEVVSFNDVLGDVSAYTGYKTAYVIKDGKTVLGDGGGVCQVSTTLFRAVLAAGLPVVERRAHAYRVGYYEQGFGPGLDATVYSPTTDFKFKNDSPAYLLIQPTIDLNNLTLSFEIYGTSDGRIATVSKPVISSSSAPAEDLYVDDPALPSGTIKQIEHRAYGAKVTFDYKVTRNGESLINQKFVSNYRPWQAVYLRGTGVN